MTKPVQNPLHNRSLLTLHDITEADDDVFDPGARYVMKLDNERLDAVVYEESYYFDDPLKTSNFRAQIIMRPEGTLVLRATGVYGDVATREEYWRCRAYEVLDVLKSSREIYDRDIRRPHTTIDWQITETLPVGSMKTVAQAHELVNKLIHDRGDVPRKISSHHFSFGDYRVCVEYQARPSHVLLRRPRKVDNRLMDTITVSVGNLPKKSFRIFLYEIDDANVISEDGHSAVVDVADHEQHVTKMWQMMDTILAAGDADVPEYELEDTKEDLSFFSDAAMAKFEEMDRKQAERREQMTQEEKDREAETRRIMNALTQLADAFTAGVDVRELMETDPRFSPEEVDDYMARMGSYGMHKNEMISSLSKVIEKAIKPLDEEDEPTT